MATAPGHRVTSVEQLRTLYRTPSSFVAGKEKSSIDGATRQFIDRCPFVLIGTVGIDGTTDVSPRGGPSGFMRVLDEKHVAIADLCGNNRLDTLENIVLNGEVGLLFMMPGHGETVRLNGRATITTDPEILGGFTDELKIPKTAIVVDVTTTFIHCAKAMRRSDIWNPQTWTNYVDVPDGAEIVIAQHLVGPEVSAEMIRADLGAGYTSDLANERGDAPAQQPTTT